MPYPARVADAWTGYHKAEQYPHAGQWEYGGALFCIGINDTELTPPTVGLYKSMDRGITWTRLSILVQPMGTFTYTFGACASINFATTSEVFVACVDGTTDNISFLTAYRFNLQSETVTAQVSHASFDIFSTIPFAYMEDCSVFIEQSTTGVLGVMSITKYLGPGEEGILYQQRRACLFSIDSDLTAFSAPRVIVPGDALQHTIPVGIARGDNGRVHGLIKVYGVGAPELQHTLVIDSAGVLGSGATQFICWVTTPHFFTADPAGGLLAFITDTEGFHPLTALSFDAPTWTAGAVFPTITEGFAFWDGALWVAVLTDGSKLFLTVTNTGVWATPVQFYAAPEGGTINVLSGGFTATGMGVFFTTSGPPVFPFPPFSSLELWFFALQLAEQLCGEASLDPVPEGCPVVPPSDSSGQCDNADFQGYGY